jgi:hypothetical protein
MFYIPFICCVPDTGFCLNALVNFPSGVCDVSHEMPPITSALVPLSSRNFKVTWLNRTCIISH